MYIKIHAQGAGQNKHLIHLWDDDGYHKIKWKNHSYKEVNSDDAPYKGLNGEKLIRINDAQKGDNGLHFHDISAHQKFLIETYGINDEPSTTHREVFFDIEIEMGGALTE